MAEERPNAGDATVALNQDSLNQQINEQIRCDKHIVQSKPVNVSAGFGPYFYKLPRELRDEIFSDLLVSGHPNFMCTSRAMEQEGKSMIAKKGIFRINVGSRMTNYSNNHSPSQEIVYKIQNVNISIKSHYLPESDQAESTELQLLDLFADPAPHRKTCNVFIELYAVGYIVVRYMVLRRLQRLRGFEELILRTRIMWTGCLDNPHALKSWNSSIEQTGKCLEDYLGKPDLTSDKYGWCMVFHPRKAVEEGVIS